MEKLLGNSPEQQQGSENETRIVSCELERWRKEGKGETRRKMKRSLVLKGLSF